MLAKNHHLLYHLKKNPGETMDMMMMMALVVVSSTVRANAFQFPISSSGHLAAKLRNPFHHQTLHRGQPRQLSFASILLAQSANNNGDETDGFKEFTERAQLRSWLSDCEPFSHLSDVELEVITQLMKERRLQKGDVLLDEGQAATEFFMVLHGTFESYEDDEDGNQVKLFSYAPGDAVGAISYASERPYLYHVRATSDEASVWCIETESLDEILGGKRDLIKKSMWSKYSGADSPFSGYLEQRAKFEAIARCDLFVNFTDNDRQAVANKLTLVDRLSRGKVLCVEGEEVANPDLYIIEEGIFEAYKQNNPKEVLKKYTNKGYFGDLSVLINQPRAESVRMTSDSAKVYMLSRNDLLEATEESSLYNVAKAKLQKYAEGKSGFMQSIKDRVEIWRLKSLPKKKSVSPHSTFGTMIIGASLVMLWSHFAPSIENDLRIFRMVVENPTHEHMRLLNACNVGMFLTMACGWLRFPKKGQTIRKKLMATINISQAFHTFVGLSNVAGPGSGYLIDAWSWPGRALIIGPCIAQCFATGVLYNTSLFGPKMPESPFFENHWRSFLSSIVFCFSNFGQMYHILPMLDSRSKFETITSPLYDAAFGNGQCVLTFYKFLTNLYLSFGGFIATLQFERKFSVRTCNIMLGGWAVLLLTDLYAFNYNIVQLAMRGSHSHMQLLSYFTGLMRGYHIDTAYFGSIALIMLYGAFQSIIKKKEMVGFFAWRQKGSETAETG